mgnify:CR=1 FL=1
MGRAGVVPVLDSVVPRAQARYGCAKMIDGEVFGKVVFTMS